MSRNSVYRFLAAIFVFAILGNLIWNITNFRVWSSSKTDAELAIHKVAKSAKSAAAAFAGPPIILWWTDFLKEPGTVKECGSVSCFITSNRSYLQNDRTEDHIDDGLVGTIIFIFNSTSTFSTCRCWTYVDVVQASTTQSAQVTALMFYGSNFQFHDVPIPRKPHHKWALIHEESPKNNWAFSNEKLMRLFNYTATFKRSSDFPLTLVWLTSIEDIESQKYYHTVEEKNKFMKELSLAPVAYVQSDCDAPSDRDRLVELLSKHIKVDSLGKCLNNKKLPEHLTDNLKGMDHSDFYELLSKYKFVVAAENAVCEDYITEKFWRSFYVGTVPIVYGSATIKDWLPSPESAIVVQDFNSVESLVKAINNLNNNDSAYMKAVHYKVEGVTNQYLLDKVNSRTWGIRGDAVNFVDAFQCHVCEHISGALLTTQSHKLPQRGLQCAKPSEFMTDADLPRKEGFWWPSVYEEEYKKGLRLAVNLTKH